MKKILLLACCLFFASVSAGAQFSIGAASGGVLGGDTYKNATFAPGYFGELQFRYLMKGNWYVSATPRFESSSYRSRKSSPDEFYYYTNSMEFPFHFGRVTPLKEKLNLFYDFGPSLHWVMTNEHYGPVFGVNVGSSPVNPIALGYNYRFNLDLGLTVGVELWNHMKVFAGFDFGVLNEQTPAFVENFLGGPNYFEGPTHPFSVRLGVGYYFSFRKRK